MKHTVFAFTLVLALVFCERPYTFSRGESAPVYISTWVTASPLLCKHRKGREKRRFRIPLEIRIGIQEKKK